MEPKNREDVLLEVANLQLEALSHKSTKPDRFSLNSPVLLAILGAIATALLALLNNYLQFQTSTEDQRSKLESALILKAMESPNEKDRKDTLLFLIDSQLVRDTNGQIRKLVTNKNVPQVASAFSPLNFVESQEGISEENFKAEKTVAVTKAKEFGIKSSIGNLVIYDTIVNQGTKYIKFAEGASQKLGGTPSTGVSEKEWLLEFLRLRRLSYTRTSLSEHARLNLEGRVNALQSQVNALP